MRPSTAGLNAIVWPYYPGLQWPCSDISILFEGSRYEADSFLSGSP
jgi:hypothetical protein